MPSRKEIDAAKTAAGGWTKEQLAEWGIAWPPKKGWKKELQRGMVIAPASHLPRS